MNKKTGGNLEFAPENSPPQAANVSRRVVLGGMMAAVMTTVGLSAEAGTPYSETASPQARIPGGITALRSASPIARTHHTATVLPNGLILITGGVSAHDKTGNSALSSVQLYDPASDSWFEAAPMLTPRSQHTAVALPNGRVVVLGGFHKQLLSSIEVYDPVANAWTYAAPMPTRRRGHAAVLAGEYILVTGGVSKTTLSRVDVLHCDSNTWMSNPAE
ncbi:MAG: hypothetical protein NT023_01720 [Armatimonadetes bacterium]|nr:hypothetical protein [Armatimonadota bacterium]